MNYFAVGFVAVLGVVALGVDYHDQTGKAGLKLGELSPGSYVATISDRISGARAEWNERKAEDARRQAWKRGGREYLPEAPAGWVRRGFDEGEIGAIAPLRRPPGGPEVSAPGLYLASARPAEDGALPLIGQPRAKDVREDVARRAWIYEHGDETVLVEIRLGEDPALAARAAGGPASHAGFDMRGAREAGFGVIGGVAFAELLERDGSRANHFRILDGAIGLGQQVHIRVHANASSEATRAILSAIDYDGLNALLEYPLATVGNDMTAPAGPDGARLATAMRGLRHEFEGLYARTAQFRMAKMGGAPLMAQAGEAEIDTDDLILAGFRQGRGALIAGDSGQPALAEVSNATLTAMAQRAAADAGGAKPAPMPKMSAALRKELGLDETSRPASESAIAVAGPAGVAPEEQAAAPPQGASGGFMSRLAGLFGGGGGGGNATNAVASRKNVTIRQAGGGGTALTKGGCGAGQFCKAGK